MTDRISTQIVETPLGKALRYAEYDNAGNFVQYKYLIADDEPIDIGTPLNKSTLLADDTAELYGLNGEKATPNEAFRRIELKYAGDLWQTLRKDLDSSWLLCNGMRITRDDYPKLFDILVSISTGKWNQSMIDSTISAVVSSYGFATDDYFIIPTTISSAANYIYIFFSKSPFNNWVSAYANGVADATYMLNSQIIQGNGYYLCTRCQRPYNGNSQLLYATGSPPNISAFTQIDSLSAGYSSSAGAVAYNPVTDMWIFTTDIAADVKFKIGAPTSAFTAKTGMLAGTGTGTVKIVCGKEYVVIARNSYVFYTIDGVNVTNITSKFPSSPSRNIPFYTNGYWVVLTYDKRLFYQKDVPTGEWTLSSYALPAIPEFSNSTDIIYDGENFVLASQNGIYYMPSADAPNKEWIKNIIQNASMAIVKNKNYILGFKATADSSFAYAPVNAKMLPVITDDQFYTYIKAR